MKPPLADAALDQLFREARSFNRWATEPVPAETLHALYDLLKLGPTATNSPPARFVFVTSAAAKAKLLAWVSPGNLVKVEHAPVTAIVAMDEAFYERIPYLFPHMPQAADGLRKDPAGAQIAMFRNASLQGAYLILAARALGLDCGPMSGFDNAMLDEAFFAGTRIRSNFLCALGAGTNERLFARSPRLSFEEACRIE